MERLDEERIHMENLVNSRFNYLLVILAIIIAGVLNANSLHQARILFICGSIISAGLSWTIIRAQSKFSALLNRIYKNKKHAATFAKRIAEKSYWICFPARISARWVIGYGFPCIIVIFMLLGSICPNVIYFEADKKDAITELKLENKILNEKLSRIEKIVKNKINVHSNKANSADAKSHAPDSRH